MPIILDSVNFAYISVGSAVKDYWFINVSFDKLRSVKNAKKDDEFAPGIEAKRPEGLVA